MNFTFWYEEMISGASVRYALATRSVFQAHLAGDHVSDGVPGAMVVPARYIAGRRAGDSGPEGTAAECFLTSHTRGLSLGKHAVRGVDQPDSADLCRLNLGFYWYLGFS